MNSEMTGILNFFRVCSAEVHFKFLRFWKLIIEIGSDNTGTIDKCDPKENKDAITWKAQPNWKEKIDFFHWRHKLKIVKYDSFKQSFIESW